MKCPECIHEERENAKYCSECGADLQKPHVPLKRYLFSLISVSTALRVACVGALLYATREPKLYDFYTTLKFIVCFVSAYLIYVSITTKNYAWIVVFLFCAVVFNPFYGFGIRRETWWDIDYAVALVMVGSIFLLRERN